jgi:hypothetical protein
VCHIYTKAKYPKGATKDLFDGLNINNTISLSDYVRLLIKANIKISKQA